MGICRPEAVGAGMWWSDIKRDPTHSMVMQEHTFIALTSSFRILVIHSAPRKKEKIYQVAIADTQEEISRDWSFIQRIRPDETSQATLEEFKVDPVLALLSAIFARWKQSPSNPPSISNGDEIIIRRTGGPEVTSTLPSPHLLHSHSDPGISRNDLKHTAPTPTATDTPLPPTNTPLPPTNTPLPHTNTPLPHTNTPLPPNNPPMTPTANTTGNNSHTNQQTDDTHEQTHAHDTPSAATFNSNTHTQPYARAFMQAQAFMRARTQAKEHTQGHAHNGSTSHVGTHQDDHECALDNIVIAEVMAWERRRANLQTKMDVLMKKKANSMQGIINDYLETVRSIVGNEAGLSEELKMRMISQEYMRLDSFKDLFSTKSSAIITCVEQEIKSTERAGKMKKSIIKLQALARGFLVRKKYKPEIKKWRHRTKCVNELLETERTYVRLIELLVKVFLIPLRESSTSKSPIIRREEVNVMFSNTESLLTMNKELLGNLEERLVKWTYTSLIGDILIRIAPYMKIYTQYVNSYNDALNTLNKCSKSPDFKEFITKCKANPDLKSMDVASFLILPVQRIPRYVLLLQEIVKVTPPSHPDCANLHKALELIQEVAKIINESKRQAENTNKVMEIQNSVFGSMEELVQPHRKFRKEGALIREVDASIEDCYIFLFSDMLLVTQKRKGFLEDNYHYIFKDSIKFARSTIRSIPDTRLWQHGFSVSSTSKHERFFADTAQNKSDWVTAITEVIEEVKKNLQSLRIDIEETPVVPEVEEIPVPPPTTPNQPPTTPTQPPTTPTQLISPTNTNNRQSQIIQPHTLASHAHQSPHGHTHHNHRRSLVLSSNSLQQLQQDPRSAPASSAPKLKQVVALYRQVLQLEAELFVLPYQVKNLLPSIVVTQQNLQELQSRVTLLSSRIADIDTIHDNVMYIIRDEKSVCTLDRLINQGTVHIDSMLKFLSATFPKYMVGVTPTSPTTTHTHTHALMRQSSSVSLSIPFQLMSSILSWYLSVSENWAVIMEKPA